MLVGLCVVLPVATVGKPSAPVKTAWQSALLGVASGNSGQTVGAGEDRLAVGAAWCCQWQQSATVAPPVKTVCWLDCA
ncbi:TPA: hypothetical protein ACNVV3_000267 [Pseudomonas putida]